MSSVTELHLDCRSTSSTGNKLMTETDTEDRSLSLCEGLLDIGHGCCESGWVTGTVRDEQAIVRLGGEIIVERNYENLNTSREKAS